MDNPCWGGPTIEEHNLQHLLHQIDSGYFNVTTATTATTTTSIVEGEGKRRQDGSVGGGDDDDNNKNNDKKDDAEVRQRQVRIPKGSNSNSKNLIVYEDTNYIVLNKPPDLRMDGPHPSTVHKLLTYWYPPPSLLLPNDNPNAATTSSTTNHHTTTPLLSRISLLSKHNNLPDNTLRPTHQLDYATSGILLLGRTKPAAAQACRAFQKRAVRKEYVAVVRGVVCVEGVSVEGDGGGDGGGGGEWRGWMDGSLEGEGRRRKRREVRGRERGVGRTFVGFLPVHSVFAKWKGLRRKRGAGGDDAAGGDGDGSRKDSADGLEPKRRRKFNQDASAVVIHGTDRPNDHNDQNGGGKQTTTTTTTTTTSITCPLHRILLEAEPSPSSSSTDDSDTQSQSHLLTLHWRDVKKQPKLRAFFEQLAKRYNRHLESTLPSSSSSTNGSNATMNHSNNNTGTNKQSNYTHSNQSTQTQAHAQHDTTTTTSSLPLPTTFRIHGEDANSFYVHASLAELPGKFRVVVDRDAIQRSQQQQQQQQQRTKEGEGEGDTHNKNKPTAGVIPKSILDRYGAPPPPPTTTTTTPSSSTFTTPQQCTKGDDGNVVEGEEELEYRPALTRCTVLETGVWNGMPVTKVLLQPRTGRRHQLRVHMAICGHPILGDATYEQNNDEPPTPTPTPPNNNNNNNNSNNDDDDEIAATTNNDDIRPTKERITTRRMCLHAYRLTIPLLTEGSGAVEEKTFTAPDPFGWRRIARQGGVGSGGDGGDGGCGGGDIDANDSDELEIVV